MNNPPVQRCAWAQSPLSIEYHDREWGTPVYDDRVLFEFLILEGTQAGLNWETILKKRANYRTAFRNFDPRQVAAFTEETICSLLENPGIIRNRRKINSAIQNARAFLEIQAEYGSFDRWLWNFVDGVPIQNRWNALSQIPAETDLSKRISQQLRQRGFSFVGPTIIYAYMQAVGLVNDHTVDCFRYSQLGGVP